MFTGSKVICMFVMSLVVSALCLSVCLFVYVSICYLSVCVYVYVTPLTLTISNLHIYMHIYTYIHRCTKER